MTTIDNGEALQGTQSAQQLEHESMRVMFTAINQLAANVSILVEEVRALRQKSEEQQQEAPQEEQLDSEQTSAMQDASPEPPISPPPPPLQQQTQETATESPEIADDLSEPVKEPQDKPESVILPPELTTAGWSPQAPPLQGGACGDIKWFWGSQ